MNAYPVVELGIKDLVMVEVNVGRYRVYDNKLTEEEMRVKTRSRIWEHWRAFFDLRSVSLLAKAPVEDSVPESDDVSAVLI